MDCLIDGELVAGCEERLSSTPHALARHPDQRVCWRAYDDGRGSGHDAADQSRCAASAAARETDAALRYCDVDLLLGLCAPPESIPSAPPGGADSGDIDPDATLALLLKYTHVVGAS